MAVVPSPGVRVTVAESLIRDLEWCNFWWMKLNASKTKTMIVSRSRRMHPQSRPLLLVELYWRSMMTLLYWEWHLIPRWPSRSFFARFPEQLLKDLVSWGSAGECSIIDLFLWDAFGVFVLPVSKYCSAVWCSAADTHWTTWPGSQWCPVSH